nr:EOG090X05Q1 [Eurycercus lamellatus]
MSTKGLLMNFTTFGLRSHKIQRLCLRTFLSDGYKCENEWKGRLNTPLLLKLKNENLYADLVKKYQNEGKLSAIDVDLFSNLVTREAHLDDLEEITCKFRRCPNTIRALPSTSHAVIRTYIQFKNTESLMRLLDDRLNYGLFLDYYLSNILMDMCLKEDNYRDATKVAIQLMLQEEFDHPISSHLALYSCYSYLRKPQPESWDPQPRPKPEEPVEVVKIRVDYLREPFFDDHFDLTKKEQLIGKTLVGFGKHFSLKSHDSVASTSLLLGWILFEKYEKVIKCLDSILSSDSKPLVHKEWLQYCQKYINESSQLPENFLEDFNSRVNRLEAGGFITENDIQEIVKERVEKAVAKQEQNDIKAQLDNYKSWENLREQELQNQIRAIEHRKRLAILEAKKKELLEKEERLNFFDNQDQWELRHEENENKRQELAKLRESRNKKVSSKVLRQLEEDAYYPPEIVKGSSKQQ